MRDVAATLEWYRTHRTRDQIGFDPDGMCLKICRTARGLDTVYPSALAAQEATPTEHRVKDVSKIRNGMVVYFDDPRDSNPFGHIVTVEGRAAGENPHSLSSLFLATNSVVADRIVTVRGDYFQKHWGDEFQFAASWLNGVPLTMPVPRPQPPKATRLRAAIKDLEAALEYHRSRGNTRLVRALRRDISEIKQTINDEYERR